MVRVQAGCIALLLTLVLAFGCGRNERQGPEAGKEEVIAIPQGEGDLGRAGQPAKAEPSRQDDDPPAPQAKNPLVRGLEELLGQALTKDAQKDLRGSLHEADDQLSRIRAENQAALREVNRQQRLSGDDSPHLLLLVAPGLSRGVLSCYGAKTSSAPRVDKLAAQGARFTGFRPGEGDLARMCWSLMTGLRAERAPAEPLFLLRPGDVTLSKVLWYAGYATALIGDCSLGGTIPPGAPGQHDFDDWFGYRDRASGSNAWPEHLWNNGASLRVLANAEGKQGQAGRDLLLQEILGFLDRRRGRPFFLCVLWPEADGAPVARLDQDLGAIVDRLTTLRMDRNTVLVLMGHGGEEAPLIAWAPGRFPGAAVIDRRCEPADILPTLADLAGARRRVRAVDGVSLVPVVRHGGAEAK